MWRHGATDEEFEANPYRAWRAAVPEDALAQRQKVILEAWDDELTEREMMGRPAVDAVEVRDRRRARMKVAGNLVLFFLAVLGAAAGVAVGWIHLTSDPFSSALAYYEAATRLNAGQPLYPAAMDPLSSRAYAYPPLFATLLRPLALLPFPLFALVWELIIGATFVGIVHRLGARKRSTWIAIGLLGIPIGWALIVAQAQIPLTLLLALGQPWSIALAANLTLFPALVALWWLGRREWESFVAFLAWTGLIVLGQVIVAPDTSVAYVERIIVGQLGDVRSFSPIAISPYLWAALLAVGGTLILLAARSRWGWAIAVTVATFSPPRLVLYMATSLLAAIREPRQAGQEDPDLVTDAALAYRRSSR